MSGETLTSFCLFQDPWWLNLTAAGNWDEAIVTNSEGAIARLPYRTLRRYGATILTQPRLTPYAGPWFRASSAKASNQFSERRRLSRDPSQLPLFSTRSPRTSGRGFPTGPPFYWAGYSQYTDYTNWYRDLSSPELLWANFLKETRAEIRKAQQRVEVVVANDVERLCDLHELAFTQQRRQPPRERAFLAQSRRGCAEGGACAHRLRGG